MDSEYRRYKEMFSKEWPPGCDPPMKAFDYFNKRFQSIDGYNWWLLPSVDERGDPKYWGTLRNSDMTMKFIGQGNFIATTRSETYERVGVVIKMDPVAYELYLDEEGYLFVSMPSEVCVGRLVQVNKMWDGTAEVDVETLREYPETMRMEWL
jgi:hypothetical protein